MLGKPEWFMIRKISGWGLTPKTWQGWAYIVLMVVPVFALLLIFPEVNEITIAGLLIWGAIFVLDMLDIMAKLRKDEREQIHEAIAERNAAWFMVAILTAGIAFEIGTSTVKGVLEVNPFIVIALIGALVVKAGTNLYMERNN